VLIVLDPVEFGVGVVMVVGIVVFCVLERGQLVEHRPSCLVALERVTEGTVGSFLNAYSP